MERAKLHRNVVALGLVSLLTDLSSEMIYPLLPVFLTSALGAGPADRRGTAFGWFHLVTGICALPASVLFGLLWNAYGAPAAFGVSAGLALAAAALLLLLRPEKCETIR